MCLHDPIFRTKHWIFYGPFKTAARAVKAAAGYDVTPSPNTAGVCFSCEASGSVLETVTCVFKGMLEEERLETLCHELHHAAVFALTTVKVPLTQATTEVLAHYQEWLFREGRKGVGL